MFVGYLGTTVHLVLNMGYILILNTKIHKTRRLPGLVKVWFRTENSAFAFLEILLNLESPCHTLLEVLHEPRLHGTQTNNQKNNGWNSSHYWQNM